MTKTIELTAEQWAELTKLREPTLVQLAEFAEICKHKDITILDDYVRVYDDGYSTYDPAHNDNQNHKLLQAVIKDKDCRLFHDDGVDEYFIYHGYGKQTPPLAHNQNLNKVVLEAAMNLWFPEEN